VDKPCQNHGREHCNRVFAGGVFFQALSSAVVVVIRIESDNYEVIHLKCNRVMHSDESIGEFSLRGNVSKVSKGKLATRRMCLMIRYILQS
jgi:hypothetical protein